MFNKAYAYFIGGWERRLNSRDPDRRVRPFDWGWNWLHETPCDGLSPVQPENPPVELSSWTQRVLAGSDNFFSYSPVKTYRLENASANEAFPAAGWLRFESPVKSRNAENHAAWARWFPASGKRAVVVLPQWNADAAGHLGLCRLLQRFGIASLRLSLPYHDRRRPAHLARAEYTVDSNIGRTIHAARQAVCDARACLDWLQDQGYESLGIVGTSLGSCYALLASAHDARLKVNVFNHVSLYFGDVVWTGLATRHVREGIATHLTHDELRDAWRAISPASYLQRFARQAQTDAQKRSLLIWARYDPCFLPEYSQQTLDRMREVGASFDTLALPCGHYTIGKPPFSYLDGFAIVRFLLRELATH